MTTKENLVPSQQPQHVVHVLHGIIARWPAEQREKFYREFNTIQTGETQ